MLLQRGGGHGVASGLERSTPERLCISPSNRNASIRRIHPLATGGTMDGQTIDIIVMIAYLACVVLIGYYSMNQIEDFDDYAVAGRSIPA